MNVFKTGYTFYAFKLSVCAQHMHFVIFTGATISIFLKIVWEKNMVLKCPDSSKILSGILDPSF